MTNEKVELEGKLYVLVEEGIGDEETTICAEVGGIDIWKWLEQHDGFNVKITLEKKDDTL